MDRYGSMNTKRRIVATPLTTADNWLDVTRSSGRRYAAYSAENTPTVQMAIAAVLSSATLHGICGPRPAAETLIHRGITSASRTLDTPLGEQSRRAIRDVDRYRLKAST